MLSEAATEFDLGPLSWVQGEIDEALTRGTEALAAFRSNPGDSASLKHARSHIHQAAGAIQMVGLDAVVAFTDEIERQLSRAEELPAAEVAGVCDLVNHACRRLRVFLDDIANGAPPVPLALYPEYEAMQKARGHDAPAPTDLFYPDLNVRAPRSAPSEIMPANRLGSHLLKERRQYQRGLLEWLRGVDGGARVMREAISAIEDVTSQANLRAFWWTAGALLEALEKGGLERSFGVKQLVARIDLQIRRVTEGSSKVADRLRREVLYFVAISKPAAPQIEAVQRAYSLATLIPSAEALDADVVRLQPLLREAREQLANAKDAWLKAASGRADSLPKLAQMLASANAKAAEIGHPALSRLAAALVERLPEVPVEGVSEPLAMEFATALLLAESAFENFNNLSPDFPGQVDAMLERLDAVRSGRSAPKGAPALDEMSRRAQERVLLSQVMREVKANLRHMEQVLDAFFRDHTRRFELAALAKDSQQVRGALRILDLDAAERLLALCQSQIETYATPETPVDEEGLELLAESLSGLGFYIDAVLHQRPDRDRMLAPLIAKRLGETLQPAAAEPQSVEDSVAELRAALPRLLADVRNAPADAAARGELRGKLASLRDDADLIGDSELVAQANAALAEIDAGGEDAALAASVDMIVESGVTPVPAISEETQRLLATDASGLDAELLDIYLAEADEVLDTVAEHRRVLDHTPGDREALVTVRRQFHTLKGSGRMVGLTELGELAWDVERMHNRLLEEDRRVTPAVLALIDVAQTSFRQWVRELRDTGRIATDAAPLQAALRAVEAELPGGASAAVPPAAIEADPGDRRFADRSDRSAAIRRIAADAHARGGSRSAPRCGCRTRVGCRPSGADGRDVRAGERNAGRGGCARPGRRRLGVAVDRCRVARTRRRRRRGSIDAGSRAGRLSRARHPDGGELRTDGHDPRGIDRRNDRRGRAPGSAGPLETPAARGCGQHVCAHRRDRRKVARRNDARFACAGADLAHRRAARWRSGMAARAGRSDRWLGDAVGIAVANSMRRSGAERRRAAARSVGAAVRSGASADRRDGAGKSHVVRHPPHGWNRVDRDDGTCARAGAARAGGTGRAVPEQRAAGAGAYGCGTFPLRRPREKTRRIHCDRRTRSR